MATIRRRSAAGGRRVVGTDHNTSGVPISANCRGQSHVGFRSAPRRPARPLEVGRRVVDDGLGEVVLARVRGRAHGDAAPREPRRPARPGPTWSCRSAPAPGCRARRSARPGRPAGGGRVGAPVSPKFSRSLKTDHAADADRDEHDGGEGGPTERHPAGAAARGRAVRADPFDAVRDGVESIAGELLRHGSSRRVGAALSRAVGRSRASDARASPPCLAHPLQALDEHGVVPERCGRIDEAHRGSDSNGRPRSRTPLGSPRLEPGCCHARPSKARTLRCALVEPGSPSSRAGTRSALMHPPVGRPDAACSTS